MDFICEAFDQMQRALNGFNDHQLHCVLRFDSGAAPDAAILRRAAIASIEAIPILGTRYADGAKPRWVSLDPESCARAFVVAPTETDFETVLVARADEDCGPQVRVCLLDGRRSAVALTLNHMICDGAGFKSYIYFLCAIYTRLLTDPAYRGDLFALGEARDKRFEDTALRLLRAFLLGEIQAGQQPLFFWAYDFEVVPLALISSIYEQFYHDAQSRASSEPMPEEDGVSAEGEEAGEDGPYAEKAAGQAEYGDQEVGEANRGAGTHYTPANLVHDALRRTLTPACLALKPKVLDPACGSGIFLVEAFRRIVRFEAQGRRRKLLPSELRNILRHRIAGVEVNAEAARVAAFSLYLALLDQQEPPDITTGGSLPYLMHTGVRDEEHYGILVVADAFALTDDERQELTERVTTKKVYKGRADDVILLANAGNLDLPLGGFDVVIGNPPWQEAPSFPRLWAASFKLPAGEGSYSQLFIHRALAMLRGSGTLGLLVGMKVFWNDRDTSRAFRRYLLARAALKQVVNMAHVRRVFFAKSVAPFAFLLAENRPPSPDERLVLWNARRARAVERLCSMAAVPLDRRMVAQRDLTDADHLWKVYWWGGHHDATLVSRLGLERTLGEAVQGVEPQPRYGWQRGGTPPSGKVAVLRELSNKSVQPFGPLRDAWFLPPPTGTKRDRDQRIYGGQRLVITRGVREPTGPVTRLESKEFTFRHSFYCIPLPQLSEDEATGPRRPVVLARPLHAVHDGGKLGRMAQPGDGARPARTSRAPEGLLGHAESGARRRGGTRSTSGGRPARSRTPRPPSPFAT
jgi:hypothetical protein